MKKRGLLTTLVAFVMAFMLPFVSVAADVYSAEELMDAIYEFNSTEDAELVIVLKADITDAVDFSTCEGKTYYIDGNTFTLADVAIYAYGGDVTIDADVEGAGAYSEAVSVYSDSEVETNIEVNGDVTAAENQDGVVVVGENLNVTVNGDITGGDTDEEWDCAGVGLVVQGENIEVLVDGDVTGGNATGGNSYGGDGVIVIDGYNAPCALPEEEIEVNETGVEVTVTGDVTGGNSENGEAGAGLYIAEDDGSENEHMDQPEVNIGGDVTGGNSASENYDGGAGIYMDSSAKVTVDGNVTGGNAAGNETEAGNGVYVVLHVKHEGDGRSWENGEIFVKGVIEGGVDSNGERAAAIHLDGNYANLSNEEDDYYLTEQEQAEYIASHLEYLKGVEEEEYLVWDMLFEAMENVRGFVGEFVESENVEEVMMECQMELLGKACEYIGEDLETLMQEDPSGDLFVELLMALSLEEQMELSKQLLAMANEMIAEMMGISVDEYLEENSIPDITVWGFGTDCENIQAEEVTAFLTEMLNKDVEYLIKVADVEGGSVAVETKAKTINAEDELIAKAGETVIVNPTPDEGYKLNKVLVSGTELTPVDGVYSFVVPEDGQVIVSAEFEKIVVEPEEPKEEPKEDSKTGENVESVIPKTNDINSFGIYVGLMIISLVCAVVVYKKTKKYNI